jgi:hypothetical protein
LPIAVKEKLLKDVEQFVSEDEKAWYALKGMNIAQSCGKADPQAFRIEEGV